MIFLKTTDHIEALDFRQILYQNQILNINVVEQLNKSCLMQINNKSTAKLNSIHPIDNNSQL